MQIANWTRPGHPALIVFLGLSLAPYTFAHGAKVMSDLEDEIFRDRFRLTTFTVVEGDEILVNTFTAGNQENPRIARLGDGGWIVVWQSQGQDGSSWGVFQQRFDSAGDPVGSETQVNVFSGDSQSSPTVAGLAGGGWVVAWNSFGQDGSGLGVFKRTFAANGTSFGEQQVNVVTNLNQQDPLVAALQGGGFVIYWRSQEPDGTPFGTFRLYHRLYDGNGTAMSGERETGGNVDGQLSAYSVAALTDGGWVASFSNTGLGSDVFQEAFTATGSAIVSGSRVNSFNDNSQFASQVAALDDGGWVVVWESALQDGDGWGIYQQRFNLIGQAVGSEMRVNSTTTGNQQNPRIVSTRNGGWVVAWSSGDALTPLLFQQAYNASGQTIGSQVQLGDGLIAGSSFHRLVALDLGGWTATWQDGQSTGTNLRQATFRATGTGIGPSMPVNTYTADRQSHPQLAATSNGWVVVWQSENQDGSGTGIFMKHFFLLAEN